MIRLAMTLALYSLLLTGCLWSPWGVDPIENFDKEKFAGRWYEIARLDHDYEDDLIDTWSEFTLREDGKYEIYIESFDPGRGKWREGDGIAIVPGDGSTGTLWVSHLGPIPHRSYHVIAVDHENYEWAVLTGSTRRSLWIFSRKPALDPRISMLISERAERLGYPVQKLNFIDQDMNIRGDTTAAAP